MASIERRKTPRPCPPDPAQCWLRGGQCAACIAPHIQEVAEVLQGEIPEGVLSDPQGRLLARSQAIAYARHFSGDNPYVAGVSEMRRRERDKAIREAYERGAKVSELGRRYQLSRARVYAILGEG